jgi:hypothetical protein
LKKRRAFTPKRKSKNRPNVSFGFDKPELAQEWDKIQLDTTPTTIEVLPEIVEAAGLLYPLAAECNLPARNRSVITCALDAENLVEYSSQSTRMLS